MTPRLKTSFLSDEAAQRAAWLDTLQRLSLALNASLDLQTTLEAVCRAAVEFFEAEHSGLVLFDAAYRQGWVEAEYPSLQAVGRVIQVAGVLPEELLVREKKPLVIPDVSQAQDLGPVQAVLQGLGIRSVLLVPVADKSGAVIGSFSLDMTSKPRRFSPEEIERCHVLAAHAALAVENARLYENARQGQAYLQALFQASSAILSPVEPQQVMQAIVDTALKASGAWRAVALQANPDTPPAILAQSGFGEILVAQAAVRQEGVSQQVLQTRRARFIPDISAALEEVNPRLAAGGTRAAACLPMLAGEQAVGVLWIQFHQPRPFPEAERVALQLYANQAAIAYEHARLYQLGARRQQLLVALDEASRRIRSVEAAGHLFYEIVRLAVELVGGVAGGLFLYRPHLAELELSAVYALPAALVGQRFEARRSLAGKAAMSGQTQVGALEGGKTDTNALFQAAHRAGLPLPDGLSVAVPLRFAGEVEAVLLVTLDAGRPALDPLDRDILERFATQAAQAVQTSQLAGSKERMFHQLALLHQVSDYIQGAGDLDKAVHSLLTGVTAGYGLGFNRVALFLLNEARSCLEGYLGIGHLNEADARRDWEIDKERNLDGFQQYLDLLRQDTLSLTPIGERIRGLKLPTDEDGFERFLQELRLQGCLLVEEKDTWGVPPAFLEAFEPGYPLVVAPLIYNDRITGLLVADNKFSRVPITREDQEALLAYVNTAAVTIQNARLHHDTRVGRERLQAFFKASNDLALSQDMGQVAQGIVAQALWASRAQDVSLALINRQGRLVSLTTARPDRPEDQLELVRPDGYTMQVMRTGGRVVLDDCRRGRERLNPSPFWRQVGAALCMPLVLEGERMGVMWFYYAQPRRFLEAELEAVQLYVNQAALALNQAQLFRQLSRVRDGAQRVARATTLALGDLPRTLEAAVQAIQGALGCDSVICYSFDERTQRVAHLAAVGVRNMDHLRKPDQVLTRAGAGATVWNTLQLDEPYRFASDVSRDPLFQGKYVELEQVKSTLAIVLRGAGPGVQAARVGVLFINYRQPHTLGDAELNNALLFANQAAVAVQNTRLYEELSRRAGFLQILNEGGKAITGTLALDEILPQVAEQAWRLSGRRRPALFCHLSLLQDGCLRVAATCPPEALPALQQAVGTIDLAGSGRLGIAGAAAHSGRPQRVGEVSRHRHYLPCDPRTASELAVPICLGSQVLGVLGVEHADQDAFDEEDERALEALASQAALAIRNAQNYVELEQRYQDLRRIKGLVGSQTVLEWMHMVSGVWGHSIKKAVGLALTRLELARMALERSDPAAAFHELDEVEGWLGSIKDIPITAPLAQDDMVAPVRLNRVIENYLNILWQRQPFNRVKLVLDLQPGLDETVAVRASEGWLRQGLEILVDNAVQAMQERDGPRQRLEVSTRLLPGRGQVQILLVDSGPGIPPKYRADLFQRPVEKPEGSRGSGVGLVLARTIFEAYNGSIGLQDTGPQGTRIQVLLPVEGRPAGGSHASDRGVN